MTNEVVRLDLCTDKALKNVFRKHIKHNIGKLDEVNINVQLYIRKRAIYYYRRTYCKTKVTKRLSLGVHSF